jgi:Na+/H+ antiporter NhaD/arsenite permease-like protein
MFNYLKKEKVMTISFILAIVSMFFVTPDAGYAEYIDLRVIALLFGLMLVVKGFQEIGLFDLLIQKVFGKVRTGRVLSLLLIMMCFFLSMLITNDVALITFVPFAIMALKLCHQEKLMIYVIVLQTIAANLGSMFTPIGNPQNLYLFTASGMELGSFFATMAPVTVLSFVLLLLATLIIPNEKISLNVNTSGNAISKSRAAIYAILFIINLLVVFRVISWIPAVIITAGVILIVKRELFKQVDYALLLTFVGFFVFVGNLGRIPIISNAIESLLQAGVIPISALFSQFLSNVPAAILLSGFTDNFSRLLIGVNIGGLGTLIASMASLISYKVYATQYEKSNKGKYLLVFSICNVIGLVILLAFSMLFY